MRQNCLPYLHPFHLHPFIANYREDNWQLQTCTEPKPTPSWDLMGDDDQFMTWISAHWSQLRLATSTQTHFLSRLFVLLLLTQPVSSSGSKRLWAVSKLLKQSLFCLANDAENLIKFNRTVLIREPHLGYPANLIEDLPKKNKQLKKNSIQRALKQG